MNIVQTSKTKSYSQQVLEMSKSCMGKYECVWKHECLYFVWICGHENILEQGEDLFRIWLFTELNKSKLEFLDQFLSDKIKAFLLLFCFLWNAYFLRDHQSPFGGLFGWCCRTYFLIFICAAQCSWIFNFMHKKSLLLVFFIKQFAWNISP